MHSNTQLFIKEEELLSLLGDLETQPGHCFGKKYWTLGFFKTFYLHGDVQDLISKYYALHGKQDFSSVVAGNKINRLEKIAKSTLKCLKSKLVVKGHTL